MILYLDFDGVLHHYDVYLDHRNRAVLRGMGTLFEYAEYLEQVLAPHPGIEIVLSTSWVRTKGFDRSRKKLPVNLRSRVIGATWHSRFEADDELMYWWVHHASRYEQITRDVARRKPSEWIALDDDDEGWPAEARSHLIACNPLIGLGEPGVRLALEDRLMQWTSKRSGGARASI
ncbi:HAD domain-containing protein [Dyella sp. Tek66A03]|uniref:HAD domain-containing protein n=1 Tax=Dyella sp. Tek66A03 TaxID=3458298 RepID=UPI00403E9A0D